MAHPSQGDLIGVDLSPTRGHEQGGYRPVLVVSANEFNKNMGGFVVVVPITTKKKSRPEEVELPSGLQVHGVLLLSQYKTIDLNAREYTELGNVPDDFFDDEVLGRVVAVFTG